jgi:hypothetical protein
MKRRQRPFGLSVAILVSRTVVLPTAGKKSVRFGAGRAHLERTSDSPFQVCRALHTATCVGGARLAEIARLGRRRTHGLGIS